ncbi:uncharacterized protein BBA_06711 [Beauveria bassiana ARSEF 2860]|uniref:Uncharacterized protein n=1 Tax=Beauveria bassiana (strain ARSEF 2860) TaxID=655819 RepID=J4KMP8_BEAB2|nr:uncharacterized protein BBA_06711 [Beauveria bassiana ARSEF 2860]EJP64329.1 hypothetical protein BBA_06711 [Beauveria bassiana ARSEF 2860]
MADVEVLAAQADIKIPPSSQAPPASQSHFTKFENFIPDDDAPFDKEFARLAASQEWIAGSQEYTKERTIAMRAELKTHYFSSSQKIEELPEEDAAADEMTKEAIILEGYQALCGEVGLTRYDTTEECQRELKKTLVNIVDLIDARRTMKEVKIWQDFEAFRAYTLNGMTIDVEEAKKDGGHLASLLQRLRGRRGRRIRGKGKDGLKRNKVSKRVTKNRK